VVGRSAAPADPPRHAGHRARPGGKPRIGKQSAPKHGEVTAKTSEKTKEKLSETSSEKYSEKRDYVADGGEELRRRLEEKSAKYAHLPVVDREEEARRAARRQEAVSSILSSVDSQLGEFSTLTSQHMASHGITIAPTSQEVQGEVQEEVQEDKFRAEEAVGGADVHTIRYRSGVLAPRHQPETPSNRATITIAEKEEQGEGHMYRSLGDTLTALTERMGSMTRDLQGDQDIPFIDHGEDAADYRTIDRTARGSLFKESTTSSSDSDSDSDSALARVLATSLNPHLRVAKIQLEVGSSTSSTLVVSERVGQGGDTLTTIRKTVSREFAMV